MHHYFAVIGGIIKPLIHTRKVKRSAMIALIGVIGYVKSQAALVRIHFI